LAVAPDPRLGRLLAAMRAVRDGDLDARAAVPGDDELAELGALFDQLATRNQALAGRLARLAAGHDDPLGLLRESVGVAAAAIGSAALAGDPTAGAGVGASGGTGTAASFEPGIGPSQRADPDIALKAAQIEQARLNLRERAQQLTPASRARAEFMANVSHELRTPLSSLLILAQLLAANAEGNLTARQVDFARTIHGAAQDLLQLINDLLDLSKVETGRMELRTQPVPLTRVLGQAEAAFRPAAAEKGLRLTVRTADDVPDSVDTDEQRLRQILRNLLSNAVKFTDHGEIALDVARDPADPALLRFSVRDTGIGVAADKLQVIFEAFQQADGITGQRFGGTGLGLSISRELARLLGGELQVSSVPGQGSTFTLTLPAGAPEAELGHGQGAAREGSPGASVLLVVEPRTARAMRQAARTALDGLGGMQDRVEIVAVHDGGGDEIEQVLAGRDVVSVLVNLGTAREQVQALLSAVADYAPAAPVLAYEAGAGSGTAARLESPLGTAPQIEIVGSRAQAVERLTLHLLTALPGASAGQSSPAAEPAQSAVRFDGETVLVVDDDVRNVFAMTSMLELHGLSVVHADNGRQGIETLLQNPDIKLVLMDLMMPGMDGFAATEYIRSIDRYAGLPIVAVTAKATRGDRERSLASGANEYVVKPVDVNGLLGVIATMLGY
jgi:signal transduction histidine kinase/CheY-like chemotaxis protein